MHIHLAPAALAKAKAIGVIAAALTAGGAGGMVALSQVTSATSTTQIVTSADATTPPSAEPTESEATAPTPTETDSATTDATPAAAPAASSYTLPPCPPDVKNHGAYVSGVAHSAPKGKGGEHGKWVSQAAHSDCGKSADASQKPEPKETESPESEHTAPRIPKPAHTKAARAPEPTTTVEGSASVSGSNDGKHKSGHGDH